MHYHELYFSLQTSDLFLLLSIAKLCVVLRLTNLFIPVDEYVDGLWFLTESSIRDIARASMGPFSSFPGVSLRPQTFLLLTLCWPDMVPSPTIL